MAKPRLVDSAGGAARRPGQPARRGARRAVWSGVNSQLRDALRLPRDPARPPRRRPGVFWPAPLLAKRSGRFARNRCPGIAGLNSPFAAPARPLPLPPAAAAVRFFVRPRPCCAASDAAARPLCPRPPLRSARPTPPSPSPRRPAPPSPAPRRRLGVCLARAAFGAAARPFCPHPLLGESRGQSPLPPPPPPPPPFEGASSPPPLRRRCVAFRPTHSARNRFSGPPCRRPRPHGGKQACKTARAKMATVIAHSKHNATHARTHAHTHAHARARARAHTRRRTRARTHAHSRTQK